MGPSTSGINLLPGAISRIRRVAFRVLLYVRGKRRFLLIRVSLGHGTLSNSHCGGISMNRVMYLVAVAVVLSPLLLPPSSISSLILALYIGIYLAHGVDPVGADFWPMVCVPRVRRNWERSLWSGSFLETQEMEIHGAVNPPRLSHQGSRS